MSSVLAPVAIEYPSTDGEPVAESDFQRDYARAAAEARFREEVAARQREAAARAAAEARAAELEALLRARRGDRDGD